MTFALSLDAATTPTTRAIELESALLNSIGRRPGITRPALVESSGFSRTAVGRRLDEFIERGLVVESLGTSGGGRPPTELRLNKTWGVLLSADLGATHGSLEVSDLSGSAIAEVTYGLRIKDGPQIVLDEVDRRFRELLSGCGFEPAQVLAIGIGVPGPVEHSTGTVIRPPIMPGWDGYRIPSFFAERYDAPTLVDNDVNLAALGEYWIRNAEFQHLLFVKISTGIGCGIVSGGLLHRGAEGAAGDIGHIRVPGNADSICACGNTGCLEAIAGGDALARQLRELGLEGVETAGDVTRLAAEGNRQARKAVLDASDRIGQVLASLVSFFNPDAIIVGGQLADLNEDLLAGIRTGIYRRALPLATRALRVERSIDSNRVGPLGARAMALENVLSPAGTARLLSQHRV